MTPTLRYLEWTHESRRYRATVESGVWAWFDPRDRDVAEGRVTGVGDAVARANGPSDFATRIHDAVTARHEAAAALSLPAHDPGARLLAKGDWA
jgi:hypothetical protein